MLLLLPLAQHVKGVLLLWQAKERMLQYGITQEKPNLFEDAESELAWDPEAEQSFDEAFELIGLHLLDMMTPTPMMQASTAESAHLISPGAPNAEWDAPRKLRPLHDVLTELRDKQIGMAFLFRGLDAPVAFIVGPNQKLAVWHICEGRYDDAIHYFRDLIEQVSPEPTAFEQHILAPGWVMLHHGRQDRTFLANLQASVQEYDLLEAAIEEKRGHVRLQANSADRPPTKPPSGSPFGFPTSSTQHAGFSPTPKSSWEAFVARLDAFKELKIGRASCRERV